MMDGNVEQLDYHMNAVGLDYMVEVNLGEGCSLQGTSTLGFSEIEEGGWKLMPWPADLG